MDSRKIVWNETKIIAVGEVICVALILGVCWLLQWLSLPVFLGSVVGGVLAVGNFFFMAVGTLLAADKATGQDAAGGKKILQLSMALRYILLFVLLFAFAKSGFCNPVAMVLPVFLVRPIITFGEFFRKRGDERQ